MLIIRLPTKTLKNNIVKIPFDSLYENVVIDLIGKANSNIAVICKRFYMHTYETTVNIYKISFQTSA